MDGQNISCPPHVSPALPTSHQPSPRDSPALPTSLTRHNHVTHPHKILFIIAAEAEWFLCVVFSDGVLDCRPADGGAVADHHEGSVECHELLALAQAALRRILMVLSRRLIWETREKIPGVSSCQDECFPRHRNRHAVEIKSYDTSFLTKCFKQNI